MSLRLLRTNQAADYLGIRPKKLRQLVLTGELPVIEHRQGSPWLFDIRDLDAHIERSKKVFGKPILLDLPASKSTMFIRGRTK